MNICPNKNSQDWKAGVSVMGEFHTMTYWMSTQGKLASPETMLRELAEFYPEKADLYNALLRQNEVRFKDAENINYMLKAVDALLSNKAREEFKKGEKNKWPLEKILTNLQIPKQQKQLILDSGFSNIDDITTYLAKEFAFPIQIAEAYTDIDSRGLFSEDDADAKLQQPVLTNIYGNLTVPGGVEYVESRVVTPGITPDIRGHAQFAEDEDIGWFRSDVQAEGAELVEYDDDKKQRTVQQTRGGVATKTRRILEIQSDVFQKGRSRDVLVGGDTRSYEEYSLSSEDGRYYVLVSGEGVTEIWDQFNNREEAEQELNRLNAELEKQKTKWIVTDENLQKSKFLQLLNKDNNWVNVFVKSIIQDSAKKGYEKVLFPSGNTASKVEGHDTLEEFKRQKEERIDELYKKQEKLDSLRDQGFYGMDESEYDYKSEKIGDEIYQLEQELERVEGPEGFGALRPIFNFYENTVANILKKQGYNPTTYTDEYGNTWNEVTINPIRDSKAVEFSKRFDNTTPQEHKENLQKRYGNSAGYIGADQYIAVANEIAAYNNERGLTFLKLEKTKIDTTKYKQSYYIKVFKNGKPRSSDFFRVIDEVTNQEEKLKPDNTGTITELQFSPLPNQEQVDKELAANTVAKLASSLGLVNELGVADFEVISADVAEKMLRDTDTPYNNEGAFFFNGRVYIVEGNLTTESVFHEFSHPFVKALMRNNRPLFEKLYEKAWREMGKQGIQNSFKTTYSNLQEGSDRFKEEVIVQLLTQAARLEMAGMPIPKSLMEVVKDIMYAIKQYIKKMIKGETSEDKINISNLSVNTSLADLANKMLTREFQIDDMVLTTEAAAEFSREVKRNINDFLEELDAINNDEKSRTAFQKNIDRLYNLVNTNIEKLLREGKYAELALLLTDEFDSKDLQNIKANIGKYTDVIANKAREVIDQNSYDLNKNIAFVNSMRRLEYMSKKIVNAIKLNLEDVSNKDNLYRVSYFNDFVKSYQSYINELKDDFSEANVPSNSPIMELINSVETNLKEARRASQDIYGKGLVDVFWEVLEPTANKIDEKYKNRIDYLKSVGASPTLIKIEEAAYQSVKLDKNKVKQILDGQTEDVSFMNSMFEGYLYNQDPLVGSFALYVKKNFIEVQGNIQQNKNKYLSVVSPLLTKAGVTPFNILQAADKILFTDYVGVNEDGDLVRKPVLTFLNEFKNHEWWMSEQLFKIAQANTEFINDKTEESRKKLNDLKSEFDKWRKLYFHQKYRPEYYERDELFERDDIGKEAKRRREEIFEALGAIDQTVRNGFEVKDETNKRKAELQKLRQLYSLYNEFGEPKQGDEKLITERLREHRELSQDFYRWRERSGVFLNDLQEYETQLELQGIKRTDPEFAALRNDWILKNTRVVLRPEYNTIISTLFEDIQVLEAKKTAAIQDKISETIKDVLRKNGIDDDIVDQVNSISDIYSIIFDLSAIHKDENRQTAANEIDDNILELIKSLEVSIIESKADIANINGLSLEEAEFLMDYYLRVKEFQLGEIDEEPTADEKARSKELIAKQKANGLTEKEQEELELLYGMLRDLRTKVPTDYYMDIYNNWLNTVDTTFIKNAIDENMLTIENNEHFLDPAVVEEIADQNPLFLEWFEKNHILDQKWDEEEGDYVPWFKRLSVWEYSLPNDSEFYETMEIPTIDGTGVETIIAQPSLQYFMREVRPEFVTQKVFPGERDASGNMLTPNVDVKGRWLPKKVTQGAPADSPFLNKEYEDLKKSDPALFEALEAIKELYLGFQEGAEDGVKLGLQLPRLEPDRQENLSEFGKKIIGKGAEKANLFKRWWLNVKEFWVGDVDSYIDGSNNFEDTEAVPDELEFFVDRTKSIPVHGRAMLDINNTSRNFNRAIMTYMSSLERHKKLVEISPVATSLQEYLRDPKTGEYKSLKNLRKKQVAGKPGAIIIDGDDEKKKKKKSIRSSALREQTIEALIDREFYGQKYNTSFGGNSAFLNNMTNFLTKAASTSYFALNIPSALINYYDAKLQNQIEAAGSRYFNAISYNLGNIWATRAMMEVSAQVYAKGPKSVNVQLIELFDPGQDFLMSTVDDAMNRHILGDLAKLNFLMNTRKWLEMQASVSILGGMLYHKNDIEQIVNGVPQKIRYIDAWEKNAAGQLVLKQGIDPKWDINGSEFKNYKLKVQQVVNNVNGAFAEYDQPQAARYLAYRIVAFLQKHFTTMFTNHFAFRGGTKALFGRTGALERYDWGLQDTSMGYFIRTLNYLIKGFRTLGSGKNGGFVRLSKEESYAIFKTLQFAATVYLGGLLSSLYFGFDDDDEDRWKKLYKKSGTLGMFGDEWETGYKARAEFNMAGWLENQALYVTMRATDDTQEWLPIPGLGLKNYSDMFFNIGPDALLGHTLTAYSEALGLAIDAIQQKESAFYKKEAGPYAWQKKGAPKFIKPLMSGIGFTGYTVDPAFQMYTYRGYDE